ncbi:vWA domain-containing protein [Sagittula salina]|uniref:VWA domain-containing protein n=1 Tax=Sagittula salina TaxID=2820268 RepID=A0A940MMR7_9RHOB|nr:VWA domain-containing protein [Sagittula salina]MBP0484361.1 VWA domain-containing protein [Sagittula salina]
MTDDLDRLKAAMDEALPPPDADRKAEVLALAMKNFEHLHGSSQGLAPGARRISETGPRGLLGGLKMLIARNTRAILTATTALAAVAMLAVIPVLRTQGPQATGVLREAHEAPVPKPEVDLDDPASPEAEAAEAPQEFATQADAAAPVPPVASPPVASPPVAMERMRAEPSLSTRTAPAGGAPGGGMATLAAPSPGIAPAPVPRPVPDAVPRPRPDTEAFPQAPDHPVKVTVEEPVSTFSIDVDTASWSYIRRALTMGQLPPKDAVRIEEMVNYFDYDYAGPQAGQPFATHVGVSDSPWRAGTRIVQIGLQGALPLGQGSKTGVPGIARPPMNLVFLIDTSGSMNEPDKLPLLKQSFRLMLGQLGAEDRVSIVTYAGSAGRVLPPTPATERNTILTALENLQAGGGTAGQAGLQQAYATAQEMARDGAVSRVILATDGDFNVGLSDPEALKDFIAEQRKGGTYLSVLGFGRGNLDDATMQALAQNGNGMAAYIDTLAEAQKVLADQLTGALVPIADDVKIQVEWNPALVAEYRLVGYETRALRREDFNNDHVDAGEIGAGHQVTALYEITPTGSGARMTDPLRYGARQVASDSKELGFLRLRYKAPGEGESRLIETPIMADAAPLPEAGWATAIAGFGQILKGSTLIGDWSMGDAIALAQASKGADRFGYRTEAITLMRLAESLTK